MLEKLFGSQCRADIIKTLFTAENPHLHLREIARRNNRAAPALQRELRQLESLGLIKSDTDGNRTDYYADVASPLFTALCEIVIKSSSIIDNLRICLQNSPIKVALIFGSVAKGTATAQSDIDLLAIGDTGLRDVISLIHPVAENANCEINPYVVSCSEFSRRCATNDHFISEIMRSPKIFIKGTSDDLATMAK